MEQVIAGLHFSKNPKIPHHYFALLEAKTPQNPCKTKDWPYPTEFQNTVRVLLVGVDEKSAKEEKYCSEVGGKFANNTNQAKQVALKGTAWAELKQVLVSHGLVQDNNRSPHMWC
eukprot:c817_g1_i1.p2 GENE.c817_g1_i1~~c817_g1_i1.p2  ORF type:complete len:115 (-),score=14.00 c817_g1_i1:38-382(-)